MLVRSENISFCGYVIFYLFLNLFSCLFSHSVEVIYGPPLSVFTHSEGANFDNDCSVSMGVHICFLPGWWWWDACRNLLLMTLLGPY